ncbi:hypothetical protein CVIRNUC_007416 [Coccomyxa viridis]|uniref:FACT complex subunit SSRP1 n=1 Tax=Coccomyxa viridis TaxID=1274662 RepID=A0AAV1IDC3_9CHLO|nr:hypothetical protein CVIRNUC_007416 [Coccomyxa viridis]
MTDNSIAQQYGNIVLAHRSGTSIGNLKVNNGGVAWNKAGGGKEIKVAAKDIDGFYWAKTTRGSQLGVKRKGASDIQFLGFREKDVDDVRQALHGVAHDIEEQEVSISGWNWGNAAVDTATMVFTVGSKPAFRIPLKDVNQVQQSKEEVLLEFAIDDTAGGDNEDALTEIGFFVPKEATGFQDGEEQPAKVLHDMIMPHTDSGAAVGDAIVSFGAVAVLAPRGRFEVELYGSFMKLLGQAQDYRVQYDAIVRIFVLPKSHAPHTLVVISLDPPIRKGQTHYPHILVQFPSDEEISAELEISDELFEAKNQACGGRLSKQLEGPAYDAFARTLRGLANSKITKPGQFRTEDGSGYAVRCSLKADDGYLYPLEKGFFYVHKPPTLLVYDEVESIEFMRQGAGVLSNSAKTFDLAVRMKHDQEHVFRGIQKGEWLNLFTFIRQKRLRIENLREAEAGPSGPGLPVDFGADIDTGLAQLDATGGMMDDDDEEDADFDDGGGSDDEDDDDSELSGMSDADDEETKKKATKAAAKPKADKPKPEKKRAAPAAKKETKKAKKDPNAPKRGLSAFMYFSNAKRDEVKKENPDLAFGEVGKRLGELWKEVTPTEKSKFEEMAKKDKARYEKEKAAYEKSGGAGESAAAAPKKAKAAPKKAAKKKEEEPEEEDDDDEEDVKEEDDDEDEDDDE